MHFGRTRRVFWRICTLGSPLLVYLLLLIAIAIYYTKFEERRARLSGREIGFEIGAAVQTDLDRSQVSDTVVLADHLVEARPEILLAIENTANTHVRWISGLSESASLEQVGGVVYLALREDDDSDERSAMQRSGALENADLVGEWSFREYRIIVYRVNTTRTN